MTVELINKIKYRARLPPPQAAHVENGSSLKEHALPSTFRTLVQGLLFLTQRFRWPLKIDYSKRPWTITFVSATVMDPFG